MKLFCLKNQAFAPDLQVGKLSKELKELDEEKIKKFIKQII